MKKSPKVRLVELQHGGTSFEQLLAERFARGLSPRQFASEFDMHWTLIYRWASRLGVSLPSRGKQEEAR